MGTSVGRMILSGKRNEGNLEMLSFLYLDPYYVHNSHSYTLHILHIYYISKIENM